MRQAINIFWFSWTTCITFNQVLMNTESNKLIWAAFCHKIPYVKHSSGDLKCSLCSLSYSIYRYHIQKTVTDASIQFHHTLSNKWTMFYSYHTTMKNTGINSSIEPKSSSDILSRNRQWISHRSNNEGVNKANSTALHGQIKKQDNGTTIIRGRKNKSEHSTINNVYKQLKL